MIRIHRGTTAALSRTVLNTVRHAASEVIAGGLVGIIVGAVGIIKYNKLYFISAEEREDYKNALNDEIERRASVEARSIIIEKDKNELNIITTTLTTERNELNIRTAILTTEKASIEARSIIFEEQRNRLDALNAILATEKEAQGLILNKEIERRASVEARGLIFEEEKNQLNIVNTVLAQEKIDQNVILSQEIERRASIEAKRASIEAKYIILETERNKLENREKENQEERLEFFKSMGNTNKIGQWGELTLRRTVERAGLCQGTDFEEQVTINESETGKASRIDMMIYLPGNRYNISDVSCLRLSCCIKLPFFVFSIYALLHEFMCYT
jgi:DNA recombination protein RmuC